MKRKEEKLLRLFLIWGMSPEGAATEMNMTTDDVYKIIHNGGDFQRLYDTAIYFNERNE